MKTKLRFIGLVRHGVYDRTVRDGPLLDSGREKVTRTATAMKNLMEGCVPTIYSSPQRRCIDTAEIIRCIFSVPEISVSPSLGSDQLQMSPEASFLLLCEHEESCEACIQVSHHFIFEDKGALVRYAERIGIRRIPPNQIDYGNAILVNVVQKSATFVGSD
jgi:phosphohistidine phosphatase SixA